jgi:kumamolisin
MGVYSSFSSERGWLRRWQLLAISLVTVLLAQWTWPASAATRPEPLVRLPGHVLDALKDAKPLPKSPGADAEQITLTIVLNRADQAGFERYLREVYDRQSPRFRRFLSQHALMTRFGPTQRAYDDVLSYLQRNGFTLVQGSANRMTLTMRGTRAQAERTFGVRIGDYETSGSRFFANDADPAVPLSLAAHVQAVMGLSSAWPHASISFSELGATLANVASRISAFLAALFEAGVAKTLEICLKAGHLQP